MKVYDILNAGPNHRFVANGVLVHNCGQVFQPQNLPSRGLMGDQETKEGIEALKLGVADLIGYDVMRLASSALRYTITASPGHKLVIADLSAIEGRVLAYLADEKWKIEAYRECDKDESAPDLYKMAYAKAFRVDPKSVTKDQRQIGKVLELSMGYQGGVGAFVNFALGFNINLNELAEKVLPVIPKDILHEATKFYDWLVSIDGKTYDLSQETFSVVDSLKRMWRLGHPATVKFWEDMDAAAKRAIMQPGVKHLFGKNLGMSMSGKWMRMHLPSGRVLCYPGMRVNEEGKLEFNGVNQFTRKWGKITTGGAKLVENCVQALSRDFFKYGQLRADEEGYKTVLVVHDELVTDVPDIPEFSVEKLEELMSESPPWALDMPLHAKGFEDYQYHK